MDGLIEFIFRNLGLDRAQQQLVVRLVWVGFVTFHILWVCGWLSFLGLAAPFVKGEEIATVNSNTRTTQLAIQAVADQVRADRLERIEHDLLAVKASLCKANTDEARRQYAQRLQELNDRYHSISGVYPRPLTCDEV